MTNDHIKVWNSCLNIIRDNIQTASFKTWFEPIVPLSLNESILTIQVPSPFFYEYLEANYIDLIGFSLKKEIGKEAKLEYKIIWDSNSSSPNQNIENTLPSSNNSKVNNNPVNLSSINHSPTIKNPFILPGLQQVNIDPQLNPNQTFESFIEGDCNRVARQAGMDIARKPGNTPFNPFFISGGSGLGKTHLVNAIGIEVKKHNPKLLVLYVTADKFMTQYIEAVRNNNVNDFIHFYQIIDLLIIDDIHEFAGKAKSQDMFFQIFNHIHQNNKQIILTSDKPAKDLSGIEQRLITRFKWGLSSELMIPDFATRIKILHQKAYIEGMKLKPEIFEYIATHITTSPRELEGVLISLIAQSTFNKKEVTFELTDQIVKRLIKDNRKELTVKKITEIVCDYFSLPLDKVNSKTRKRDIVQARQIAMYFSKVYTKSSLSVIGLQIGGKDHATVLHANKTVKNLMETDKHFKSYIEDIDTILKR